MAKRFSTLLLMIVVIHGISACSYIFPENKFEKTLWRSKNKTEKKDAGALELDIYSRNRIKAVYGKTKKEYLYYVENNEIRVTNINDYSQSVLKPGKNRLTVDPKYFGFKADQNWIVLERIPLSDISHGKKSGSENKTAGK
jgi:hypothetical protein